MQSVSFWNIIAPFIHECCAVVRKLPDPICEGSFQLRSKPPAHHVLHVKTTGRSSSMEGFI